MAETQRAPHVPLTARALAFVQLARPGNVLMAGLGVIIGSLVVGQLDASLDVALATLATMLVVSGGNAFNDLTDLAVDEQAHPTRPLPAGRLSVHAAIGFAVACLLIAVALGYLVSFALLLLVLAAEALLIAYEVHLKASGLVGNIVVALLVGATFLAGALAVGSVTPTLLLLATLATLANLGREVWKDMEDAASDQGRRTLAQVRGAPTARAVAIAATAFAVALSPLPALLHGFGGVGFLAGVVVADVGFVAAMVQRAPARAQRLAKLAMLAALVAFTIGAFEHHAALAF